MSAALESAMSSLMLNEQQLRALCSELALRPQAARPVQRTAHDLQQARVMIIDDEPINVKVARKYLYEAGYREILNVNSPAEALQQVIVQRPDVILLDVMMPDVNGLDILRAIRARPDVSRTPVVILTASCERETRLEALEAGATDFLEKPVDPAELLPRVRNALLIKAQHDDLERHAEQLEDEVHRRTAELALSRLEVVHCLARAAEFRDDNTGRHVIRVGRYAGVIGRKLDLSDDFVHLLELAAQLHDVGKIGVPDDVLLKSGVLTPAEYEIVQRHCGYGKRVFEQAHDLERRLQEHPVLGARMLGSTTSPLIQLAARVALTHHERWDGGGYPLGLAGEDIPLEGRITAVADVFDALSSRRPYKPAFPLSKCFQILEEGRGNHFDPTVLDAFFAARDDILRIQLEYADVD